MHTNNKFSFQRLMMLFKQSLRVNKKVIGISLGGVTGVLFLSLILLQNMSDFQRWTNRDYIDVYLFFFFSLGIIYSSQAFPAFRSKEKSMTYLTLPVSTSEKYIFELLTRVIGFILLMPLLFWIVANIEGSIVHYYEPSFINYKFSFNHVFTELNNSKPIPGWNKLAIIQSGLFVFIAVFTGASHFKKSPLVKTLFAVSVVIIGYLLFIYLLYKGLNINKYSTSNNRVLFIKSEEEAIAFYSLAATVVNLSLLAIAWFRIKEKEI